MKISFKEFFESYSKKRAELGLADDEKYPKSSKSKKYDFVVNAHNLRFRVGAKGVSRAEAESHAKWLVADYIRNKLSYNKPVNVIIKDITNIKDFDNKKVNHTIH